MPSSRWESMRSLHFIANSLEASGRGMKFVAKLFWRPCVRVPAMRAMSISVVPMGISPWQPSPFRMSSSAGR